MNCEVCGKAIPGERRAIIADAMMVVCETCARFGKEIQATRAAEIKKVRAPYSGEMPAEQDRLAAGWGEKIRKAREQAKLTQEELAKKISEKAGLVRHVESEKQTPEDAVVKKIEKALNIKLKEKIGVNVPVREAPSEALTLGDMIKIKKRKQ